MVFAREGGGGGGYALISGHPRGVTPGTYRGMVRDLLTFVANF